MPVVSEKQRRAMWAAANGHSTLGIPQSVGREFVSKDEAPAASGVMLTEPNGAMLMVKRSKDARDHAGAWAFPGGMIEDGERPDEAALRELEEEIGAPPDSVETGEIELVDKGGPGKFWTYRMPVTGKFDPMLNSEHEDFQWASPEGLPEPLHPGVARTMAAMGKHRQAFDHAALIALDRESVRSFDKDGHMHVSEANISKATINPYIGAEIPNWQELGLDPKRVYRLLRDPNELAKGAASFAGKPLLFTHKPTTAEDHQGEDVVGAVMNPRFEHPYLKAELVVWPGAAIDAIKDGSQKQLSAGYRYTYDPTPGIYEGEQYDGRMTNIIGNHLAMVAEGRVGPDAVVGDSMSELHWGILERAILDC